LTGQKAVFIRDFVHGRNNKKPVITIKNGLLFIDKMDLSMMLRLLMAIVVEVLEFIP